MPKSPTTDAPPKSKRGPKSEPKYDAQKVFETALASGTQTTLVPREHEPEFPLFSSWFFHEREYQVYMVLNAGPFVKIGFMPVKGK